MRTSGIAFKIVILILAATLAAGCSREAKRTRLLQQADTYFRNGSYDKAKLSYVNALTLDPTNALIFERLGLMWLEDGAPRRAAPFLAKAAELDSGNYENRLRLSRCYLATGHFAEAAREASKILEQDPANGTALVTLTDAARTREELEAAAGQLEKFPSKATASFHLASANLFLREGNMTAAGEELRQALEADPKAAATHMAMGDFYLLQKDQKQAAQEFEKAAQLAPIRSMERLKCAAFKSAIGDLEATRRMAAEMTTKAPDYLPGWVLLAEVAFKEKKNQEALSLLENVFGRDPEYLDGRRLQCNVLLAKGEIRKAVETLERLDQTYPDTPIVKYQLAQAYLKSDNPNQAKAELEQALAISPNYVDAVLLLAEINLHAGHAEPVIEPVSNLLKRQPDLKSAALLLAAAYGSLGRFDDAVVVLGEQAKLAPEDPQILMALGFTYRQAKRNDEARGAFEKVVALSPTSLSALNQLVELDLLDKRFDAARTRIRRQFQNDPNSATAHFFEGKILAAEEKWEDAVLELQKAVQLDPNFSEAYQLLVEAYIATNRLLPAAKQLQSEISKTPRNPAAWLALAMLYERMNVYDKARDAYEEVLSIDPGSVPALNNLANLYVDRLNNLDRAYELARKAHDLRANDPAISDTLGWVLFKRGEYRQALPVLQASAERLPNNPEAQFHLGITAYMMGQADLAQAALEKAAGARKDFPGKEEIERTLAILRGRPDLSPQLSLPQLEAMAKTRPDDVLLWMRLGEIYDRQHQSEQAAKAFEQALQLNPALLTAALRLAELYAGPLHNIEKALSYAKKARDLAPADPKVAATLGKIAGQSGNFTWAYSLLQEAVRQGQKDGTTLHSLAWAAYGLSKLNEARDIMQKALNTSNFPEAADARKFLRFTVSVGNPDNLITENDVKQELTQNPHYIPALMAQAKICESQYQPSLAIGIYADILRQWPDFGLAQKSLAALYAGDPSTTAMAYDLASKARKTLPADPELLALLGQLSYEKKDYQRAIELFEESARKSPLNARSLFYLGMSQLQTRQIDQARGALNQALTAGLQEPLAAQAKRTLADLQHD